jgi:hypothetical protein
MGLNCSTTTQAHCPARCFLDRTDGLDFISIRVKNQAESAPENTTTTTAAPAGSEKVKLNIFQNIQN